MINRLGRFVNQALSPLGIQIRRIPPPSFLTSFGIRTILDIGANEGQFAASIRAVLPDADLHSFEPLPQACARLKLLAARDPHWFVHHVALGEANGVVEINGNTHSPSSSVLAMTNVHLEAYPFATEGAKIEVPMVRLDDWAPQMSLTRPILVKMDVQGYEDRVVRGGTKLLQNTSVLLVEASFHELYRGQVLFDELYRMIRELGFSCRGVVDVSADRRTGLPLQADVLFARVES